MRISIRGTPGALRGGTFPKKRSISAVKSMKRADKGHRRRRRLETWRGKEWKQEARRKKTQREKMRNPIARSMRHAGRKTWDPIVRCQGRTRSKTGDPIARSQGCAGEGERKEKEDRRRPRVVRVLEGEYQQDHHTTFLEEHS
ncbi:hypothetical protein NDU88_001273 [Pleurodeles waltl]|uniref:Uncharacterized protein n=1 Tax=Pleurodeles waltl TaxID=8319 RepID=A0AAV7TJN0_PLEWA|nr:hypothetical protein NDU88_001273 [Pleurodeles waltl]